MAMSQSLAVPSVARGGDRLPIRRKGHPVDAFRVSLENGPRPPRGEVAEGHGPVEVIHAGRPEILASGAMSSPVRIRAHSMGGVTHGLPRGDVPELGGSRDPTKPASCHPG